MGRIVFSKYKANIFRLSGYGLLILFFSTNLAAQKKDSVVLLPPPDKASISVRKPQPELLEKLRSERAYRYEMEEPPATNPVQRFIKSVLKAIYRFLQGSSFGSSWNYLILFLAAGIIIYLFFKAKSFPFMTPHEKIASKTDLLYGREDIHKVNFDTALENALRNEDYRLGIRILYLKTLKLLADQSFINWHPERTNQNYVQDLSSTDIYDDFKRITYFFEYAWYGDFRIGQAEFKDMEARVLRLTEKTAVKI